MNMASVFAKHYNLTRDMNDFIKRKHTYNTGTKYETIRMTN